jgi:fructose-1,6-bisphosphatase I
MTAFPTLRASLTKEHGGTALGRAVIDTVEAMAQACAQISRLVAAGPMAGNLGAERGENKGGDAQKALDVIADEMIIEAMRNVPVAVVCSEELDDPVPLSVDGLLVVAIDPLDGSNNIDINGAIGTIFSIAPYGGADAPVLTRGTQQIAAGFVIYGFQTALVLTLGAGTNVYTLDRDSGQFLLTRANAQIGQGVREFAINASNYRHWDAHVRDYVDDCMKGKQGPRAADYNMRWYASLVGEVFRILTRGGVFLYPGDARKGYSDGRLRLVYEANPIAFVIEQAGGRATSGIDRIMEIDPTHVHQRIPLVLGSCDEVDIVETYFRKASVAQD